MPKAGAKLPARDARLALYRLLGGKSKGVVFKSNGALFDRCEQERLVMRTDWREAASDIAHVGACAERVGVRVPPARGQVPADYFSELGESLAKTKIAVAHLNAEEGSDELVVAFVRDADLEELVRFARASGLGKPALLGRPEPSATPEHWRTVAARHLEIFESPDNDAYTGLTNLLNAASARVQAGDVAEGMELLARAARQAARETRGGKRTTSEFAHRLLAAAALTRQLESLANAYDLRKDELARALVGAPPVEVSDDALGAVVAAVRSRDVSAFETAAARYVREELIPEARQIRAACEGVAVSRLTELAALRARRATAAHAADLARGGAVLVRGARRSGAREIVVRYSAAAGVRSFAAISTMRFFASTCTTRGRRDAASSSLIQP